MNHFPIVLALVRAASRDRNPAVMQHAERLRQALEMDGASEEAHALDLVFQGVKRPPGELAPSRVVLSRASAPGEQITPNTHPPLDKETSTPLAEIWTVERLLKFEPPLLNEGLDDAVAQLMRQWERADDLLAAGVKVPSSCLLFGAPGTGKTRLAMTAAARIGLPVVLARLDGLMSSFLGTTARNVRALFDFANRHRCLLLLDEFDGIAKVRDDPHELGEVKRVVNAVLQAVDGRAGKGFTVAITNHEGLLDPAVWRRFDARVEISRPDVNTRLEILRRYISPLPVGEGAMKVLGWMADGYSGSDIETMCEAIRRQIALDAGSGISLLAAIETHLRLSAEHNANPRRTLLLTDKAAWAREVLANKETKIVQADLAEIMGQRQSSVSRMVDRKRVAKRG